MQYKGKTLTFYVVVLQIIRDTHQTSAHAGTSPLAL